MPTLLETASKLNEMLDTGWALQTPIKVDNVPYEEIQDQSYLSTKFLVYTSENVNIAAATQKRGRSTGALSIKIRTPINEGIGLAYSYAQDIETIMDNKQPLSNLFTYKTETRRSGDAKDGWYTLICDVPFTSDNI